MKYQTGPLFKIGKCKQYPKYGPNPNYWPQYTKCNKNGNPKTKIQRVIQSHTNWHPLLFCLPPPPFLSVPVSRTAAFLICNLLSAAESFPQSKTSHGSASIQSAHDVNGTKETGRMCGAYQNMSHG